MKICNILFVGIIVALCGQFIAADYYTNLLLFEMRRKFWLEHGYVSDQNMPYFIKVVDGQEVGIRASAYFIGAFVDGYGNIKFKWQVNGNLIQLDGDQ